MALRQELEQLQSRTQTLMRRAPVWLAAQNSLNQLCEQSGEQFASGEVTEYLQQLLEREREAIVERDEVGARKRAIDEEIERLSQPGGSEDPRLNATAERFGGVLLSGSTMMLARTMRRTSPRCTVRRAMRSWYRICRG